MGMTGDALGELAGTRRIVVCCGAGGVGKTTVSAAVGLAAARRGRRAVVLTIDPARRLADALGLPSLPAEPAPVPRPLLDRAGVPPSGSLHALMLDPKDTFDRLVQRLDPQGAPRILKNRLYQHISGMLAGMQEYTAEEKLHELHGDPRFDVVVVDTPPSRNALDFLDAPGKLSRFLDERVLRWFVPQKGLRSALLARTGRLVSSVLSRIFGQGFTEELAGFLGALGGMTATFRAHAEEVRALLGSPQATFLLVTAPEPAAVEDALHFRSRLDELHLPFGGYVVNRFHPDRDEPAAAELHDVLASLQREVDGPAARELLGRIEELYAHERARGKLDRQMLSRLLRDARGPVVGVPHLTFDLSDVGGLAQILERSFAGSAAGGAGPTSPAPAALRDLPPRGAGG
jgi:anion-transporting  ArsA/GET3 family ATPase